MRRAMKVLGGMGVILLVAAAAFVAFLYGSQKPNSFLCKYHVGPACIVSEKDNAYGGLGGQNSGMFVREDAVNYALAPQTMSKVGMGIVSDSMAVGMRNVPTPSAATERMVIKTGSVSMLVKDVQESVKTIAEYAAKKGGYVVNSWVEKEGIAPSASITVRLPAKEFDNGLKDVKAMGELKNENVNGQDVTEEYIDLDSQLTNLEATEAQFMMIMAEAKKIPDILAVQRELRQVRGEIESIQGRMKYLRLNAELASLTVSLATDPNVLPTTDDTKVWKPWGEFKDAVRSLAEAGKKIASALIWIVVFSPFWLLAVLALWLAVKIYRKMSLPRI